jgi:hypothetical protein
MTREKFRLSSLKITVRFETGEDDPGAIIVERDERKIKLKRQNK